MWLCQLGEEMTMDDVSEATDIDDVSIRDQQLFIVAGELPRLLLHQASPQMKHHCAKTEN